MITIQNIDIFQTNTEALVNPVNCVGVMGKGLALQFKSLYPDNYYHYYHYCMSNSLQPGTLFTYNLNRVFNPHYIINFPTKLHWKSPSLMEYIDNGLVALHTEIQQLKIQSIAIPPLGCGLGGLNQNIVISKIKNALNNLNINIIITTI
jgi:O-acetyl-ADP-ribose deacetylase (regulator of RNase III)